MTDLQIVRLPELEAWKNESAGKIWIQRLDHRGELSKTEMINPGQVFHIAELERTLNSERVIDPKDDFFKNGVATPVRLANDCRDAEKIASNPNLATDDDMRALVTGDPETLEERIGKIINATTLRRLLEIALAEDASVGKVNLIQAALDEHEPKVTEGSVTYLSKA